MKNKTNRNSKDLLFEMMEKVNPNYKRPQILTEEKTSKKKLITENIGAKTLVNFAQTHNLAIKPVKFKFQGISNKRQGFDLVNNNNQIQLTIEPVDYVKNSMYSKDRWLIKDKVNGTSFYIQTITQLPQKLDNWSPIEHTGYQRADENHDDIDNESLNENKDDLIAYDIPEWALPVLVNGDYSGLSDEDEKKINDFSRNVAQMYGNANFMLGDYGDNEDGEDVLGFRHENDIDYLGSHVYRMYIKPTENFTPSLDEEQTNENIFNDHNIDPVIVNDKGKSGFNPNDENQLYINKTQKVKNAIDGLLKDGEFDAIDTLMRLLGVKNDNLDEHHSPIYQQKADRIKGKIDFLFDTDHYDIIDKLDIIIDKLYPMNDEEIV